MEKKTETGRYGLQTEGKENKNTAGRRKNNARKVDNTIAREIFGIAGCPFAACCQIANGQCIKKGKKIPFREIYQDEILMLGCDVLVMQTLLREAGFYTGAMDGIYGARTQSAVRLYQRARGMRVDGYIDRRLALRLTEEGTQPLFVAL